MVHSQCLRNFRDLNFFLKKMPDLKLITVTLKETFNE